MNDPVPPHDPVGGAAALRARNRRTGLLLAAVALVFFVGVILKYALAHH